MKKLLFFLMLIFPCLKLVGLEPQRDCERFRQTIHEFELELLKQEKFLKDYDESWMHPSSLPWDFKMRIAERKSQILKDIHYFRGLLKTNYCAQKSSLFKYFSNDI